MYKSRKKKRGWVGGGKSFRFQVTGFRLQRDVNRERVISLICLFRLYTKKQEKNTLTF
jgi:hypothetical protein